MRDVLIALSRIICHKDRMQSAVDSTRPQGESPTSLLRASDAGTKVYDGYKFGVEPAPCARLAAMLAALHALVGDHGPWQASAAYAHTALKTTFSSDPPLRVGARQIQTVHDTVAVVLAAMAMVEPSAHARVTIPDGGRGVLWDVPVEYAKSAWTILPTAVITVTTRDLAPLTSGPWGVKR